MKIEKIAREAARELLSKNNVIMVVPGTKKTDGIDTGKKAIVVGVIKKLPLAQLAADDIVPKKIKGVVTDVIEVDKFDLLERTADATAEEENPDRKKKWRPAPGGVSIGHVNVTAGTLGMVVKKNGKRYILSNNHVLANINRGQSGDPILQPGAYDGGREADKIAELYEYVPIIIEKTPGSGITLLSPNGGESWTIGETVLIKWQAEFQDSIRIELSQDGGISWVTIVSSVPAQDSQYSWKVLPLETQKARIKVIQINSPYSSDMSDGNFVIQQKPPEPKPPEPSTCKTSKAVASALNLLWAAAGKKTRFMAVVLASSESEFNLVDAALAKPINDADVLDEILEIGMPAGSAEPEVGMKVKKSGRTTGLTQKEITHLGATIKIDLGEGRFATFTDQILIQPMVEGGDSGSTLFTEDNRVVGLIFAGNDQIAVANNWSNVKKALVLD